MELIRSVVFVPGNRPNMLERALNFAADVIMVDLEDSVPLAEKVHAREVAREWVPKLRRQGRRGLDTHAASGERDGHTFNRGHGISQFTPPEAVTVLVDEVHSFSRALRKKVA